MSKVKFVTSVENLADTYPVVRSGKHLPDWLAEAKPTLDEVYPNGQKVPAIKSCPGIMDLATEGYVMPLWTDIVLTRTVNGEEENTNVESSWEGQTVSFFDAKLMQGYPFKGSPYTVKLLSPWVIQTEPGYSILTLPMPYHKSAGVTVVPGVLDSDILHKFNLIMSIDEPGVTYLKAGTPMIQLFVYKREKFEIETVTDEKLFKTLSGRGKGGIGPEGNRFETGMYRKLRALAQRGKKNG